MGQVQTRTAKTVEKGRITDHRVDGGARQCPYCAAFGDIHQLSIEDISAHMKQHTLPRKRRRAVDAEEAFNIAVRDRARSGLPVDDIMSKSA